MKSKIDKAQDLNLRLRLEAEKKRIVTIAEELRQRKASTINLSQPIVVLDNAPVIYPNTIAVIQGKTGSHKSHVAQNIVSAVIAKDRNGNNTMGFRCTALAEVVVVYIDTERNQQDQFPLALQSMLRNAGYRTDEDPENFEYCSFGNIQRDIRYLALNDYLSALREKHKEKHLVVVLDVITDFVSSFNDDRECMLLIDFLNEMCNQHKASVIGVIHENPGSEKARGHLGTELQNKATTQLQTVHNKTLSDGTQMYALHFKKTRNDQTPKPVYMQYDAVVNNLVINDTYKPVTEKLNAVGRVQKVLPFNLLQETSRPELLDALCRETGLKRDAIIKALGELKGKQGIFQHYLTEVPCTLGSRRDGQRIMYFMEATQTEVAINDDKEGMS